MSFDNDKISYVASQLGLRPDQRKALHEFLKPYTKATAAAPEISAATSRRLARLDAARESGSAELRCLELELKRLGIGIDHKGVDVAAIRKHPRLGPEKRMQLIMAAAQVGLAD